MAEGELPGWIIAALGWSERWDYTLFRGLVAILGTYLVWFGIFRVYRQSQPMTVFRFRRVAIIFAGLMLTPASAQILVQYWPISWCQAWRLSVGGAWFDHVCETTAPTDLFLGGEEMQQAAERIEQIEATWPYQLAQIVVTCVVLWAILAPVRRRLVIWWNQRRTK